MVFVLVFCGFLFLFKAKFIQKFSGIINKNEQMNYILFDYDSKKIKYIFNKFRTIHM